MYEPGGVTFWIMRNLNHLVAVWSGGDLLSVSVSAPLDGADVSHSGRHGRCLGKLETLKKKRHLSMVPLYFAQGRFTEESRPQ